MCCLPLTCCCGWQGLEHGLFIFSVTDLLINLAMIAFTVGTTIPMVAGFGVLLVAADIALAVGAKNGLRLLLLFWLVVFMVHIIISIVLPPIGLLFLFLMDTLGHEGGASGTGFQDIIDHILNLDSSRTSHIKFYLNFLIRFVLGFFYVYIWICVRSLFLLMAREDYIADRDKEKNQEFSVAVSDSSARSGQLTGSGRQEAWSPAGHAGVVNPGFQETRMFNPEGSNGLVFRNTNNNNKMVLNGEVYPSSDGVVFFPDV